MAKRLFRSDIDKEWHEIDNRNWLEDADKEDLEEILEELLDFQAHLNKYKIKYSYY